ncbi:MAG: hypothetical protein ACREIT_08290, partial [Tepidisphaeraceae bacterium]
MYRWNWSKRNRAPLAKAAAAVAMGMESLEARRLFALTGIAELQFDEYPRIEAFDDGLGNSGVNYDGATFSANSFPLSYLASVIGPLTIIENGGLTINIAVDSSGNGSGTTGDDFVLSGDFDTDGDGNTDFSGVALSGELVALNGFGWEDTSIPDPNGGFPGTLDNFDFRFEVTGGQLASAFAGKDIGVSAIAYDSSFNGSFTAPFSVDTLHAIVTPVVQGPPPVFGGSVSGTVFDDTNGNGALDSGEAGVAGVSVFFDSNSNGLLDSGEQGTSTDGAGVYT